MTKKYKRIAMFTGIISFALSFFPITLAFIQAFRTSESKEKMALTGVVTIFLIMAIVNLLQRIDLKCGVWILLLGVHIVLENVVYYIALIAICTAVEEIFVSPVHKHFKNKYTINKEFDARNEP